MSVTTQPILGTIQKSKTNTALKAGVTLLTALILASCSDDSTYIIPLTTPVTDTDQAEKQKAEREQAEKQRAEREQAEKEKAEKEKAEKEKAEKEKAEKEKAEDGKAEDDKAEDDKAEDDKAEDDKAEDDKDDKKPTPPADPKNTAVFTTDGTANASLTGVQTIAVGNLGKTDLIRNTGITGTDASKVEAQASAAVKLLPNVDVTIGNSKDIGDSKEAQTYNGDTIIPVAAVGAELPFKYSSVYRDFGTVMRISHINGDADAASAGLGQIPVNGVAVIGNETAVANVPTDGTAQYSGISTYNMNGGNDIQNGTASFDVDFAAKTVAGTLTAAPGGFTVDATISGNTFSGTNTEGGFYGNNAEVLGGVYQTEDGQGTYGAER